MLDNNFFDLAGEFINSPCPKKAFEMINAAKPFIISQAKSWGCKNISFAEKIREIMAEIFLILMEDFKADKALSKYSVLNYIKLRIKRLTHPTLSKTILVAEGQELKSNIGRAEFDPEMVYISREIFTVMRNTLFSLSDERHLLTEFLFVHIHPELAWTSRLLAKKYGLDSKTCVEADKKRHQKFNQRLRQNFDKKLKSDWKKVHHWPQGARHHLAFKIMDISFSEVPENLNSELNTLYEWKSKLRKMEEQSVQRLQSALIVCKSMQKKYSLFAQELEEESEIYFTVGKQQDFLISLLQGSDCHNLLSVKEDNVKKDLKYMPKDDSFDSIAKELAEWISILADKRKALDGEKNELYNREHY